MPCDPPVKGVAQSQQAARNISEKVVAVDIAAPTLGLCTRVLKRTHSIFAVLLDCMLIGMQAAMVDALSFKHVTPFLIMQFLEHCPVTVHQLVTKRLAKSLRLPAHTQEIGLVMG